jgi:hypothetical protein
MRKLLGLAGLLTGLLVTTVMRAGNLHSFVSSNSDPVIRAGVAAVDITPSLPIWLTGYANRDMPATGIAHSLWAKALVLEENPNSRIIIVTVDLLGLSHEIVEDVTRAVEAKYAIKRSQLLFNSSHTHSGPMIWPCLDVIYDLDSVGQQEVSVYGHHLTGDLVRVIDSAMANLLPVRLYSGHGQTDFASNRRNQIHANGPVDHDVPVLKVADMKGRTLAVLFGYACHNTTVVDERYLINGDYAGFAQLEIERNNPGAKALFMMGCAGDQDPAPRGTLKMAEEHGKALADEVQKVLKSDLHPVRAPIQTDYKRIDLAFRPFDVSVYQRDIVGSNRFLRRRAKLMLEAYNKGWPVDKLSYPIQAVRFSNDFTILALGDEVVVDYSLSMKKEFASAHLFVAGYCNEVQCYIPTRRLLGEGGYEPDESMIYYGFPGPFSDDVEDRIKIAIRQVMKNIGF